MQTEHRRCYLVIIGVVVGVLLLQQLSLPPLLLQGLLDERRHLALLTRTLSANHKPASQDTFEAFLETLTDLDSERSLFDKGFLT